jgi:hypothetical protein
MSARSRSRSRRWLLVFLLLLVAVPGGYFAAREYGLPAYRNWREARLARMTEQFMASGDYDNALLTARQALRRNQRSLMHWRLAAAAAKAKGTPEVVYYQRNVAQLDKSLASQLELIRLALQFNAYRDALDAIEAAGPSASQDPEFHALSARAYLAVKRTVAAKTHLYSLVTLRPEDAKARLDLAELELAEDPAGANQTIRADIRALGGTPELRQRARVLLLRDAVQRGDGAGALEVADQLQHEPVLGPDEKVLVLSGLDRAAPERAEDYRERLRAECAHDPAGAIALANYYRGAGEIRAAEARAWFESLPSGVREDSRVRESIAAAFLEWNDWTRLDAALVGERWTEREFIRQAFTAYSARKSGRVADAGNAWRLAVIEAGDNVRDTSELLTLVAKWGWQTEQYDLVWKLFALMPRNEAISRQLIAWERAQGRTANLNRIFARLMEFSGDDPMIRNNFAYSSLLLNANLSRAYELAQRNHRAEPDNPYFVTTQALALYKQNQPAEALALLETLRPAALAAPERTLFRAVYRAATGDASGAADGLDGVNVAGLLPEERKLLNETAETIARLNGDKGQDERLVTLNRRGEIDPQRGWLAALPEPVRRNATPEMRTSDALLATGDLKGLAAQLRQWQWGAQDHLRMALAALTARERSDPSSARSYWRSALAAATGDAEKLRQLEGLAAHWNWQSEKTEVLARRYDIDPSDRGMFETLMTHHRGEGRTAEMVSVLQSYVSAHPGDREQACELAYYRMLSGLDISRAYLAARDAYDATPRERRARLVYAFALWKQSRPQEAMDLIDEIEATETDLVPAALLRAAVLADLNRAEEARAVLERFDAGQALPEEAKLGTMVASRIKSGARVSGTGF